MFGTPRESWPDGAPAQQRNLYLQKFSPGRVLLPDGHAFGVIAGYISLRSGTIGDLQATTLAALALTDEIRRQAGIVFPFDAA